MTLKMEAIYTFETLAFGRLNGVISLKIEASIVSNTVCFKKTFAILKACINLFRGHVRCFGLSQCSNTHRILLGIVTVQ
jgi:hypothetical protein